MTSAMSTLTPSNTSDKSKALAQQFWQKYGTQMMATIGCGS
jgi:hypothetical protein